MPADQRAVVKQAVALGLADTKVAVADMTAQEAAIPVSQRDGIARRFRQSIEAAARKADRASRISGQGAGQAAGGQGAGAQVPTVRQEQDQGSQDRDGGGR